MSGTVSRPDVLEAARRGDNAACEQVLQENAGLIWSIVRRYYGRGVDPEDLYQLACLGFVKAVRGYDPAFGTQFSTYAVPKIAGEIRRFLRDDGAVKVSRGVKEQAATIRAARTRLQTALNRDPTLSELSEELSIPVEEIAAAETAMEPVVSLQMETGDGLTLESMLSTGGMEEQLVEQLELHHAIRSLPDTERQVIALRFFKGMTQSTVARIVGVSQVQVSRMEKRAIAKLRDMLDT